MTPESCPLCGWSGELYPIECRPVLVCAACRFGYGRAAETIALANADGSSHVLVAETTVVRIPPFALSEFAEDLEQAKDAGCQLLPVGAPFTLDALARTHGRALLAAADTLERMLQAAH